MTEIFLLKRIKEQIIYLNELKERLKNEEINVQRYLLIYESAFSQYNYYNDELIKLKNKEII